MKRKAILTTSGAGIGGLGGLTALTANYLLPHDGSIKGTLRRKGIRLISFDLDSQFQSSQWAAEYVTSKSEIQSLIGYSPTQEDIHEGGRRLRNWCDGVMSKDAVSNKQDLDNASKYCGIKNIKQQLERLGVKVFEEGDSDWQSVYTKRKNENSSASTFEEIKKWCFSTRNKDFVASKMSTDYADVLRYCTDKGKVGGIHTKSIEINNMIGQ